MDSFFPVGDNSECQLPSDPNFRLATPFSHAAGPCCTPVGMGTLSPPRGRSKLACTSLSATFMPLRDTGLTQGTVAARDPDGISHNGCAQARVWVLPTNFAIPRSHRVFNFDLTQDTGV